MSSSGAYRSDMQRGELYWLDWSPGGGSEQTGLRPALVIQSNVANQNANYSLTVVLTVSTKGRADVLSHVPVKPDATNGLSEASYVKTEQIMTVEKSRLDRRIGKLSADDLSTVASRLRRVLSL